MGYTQIYVRVSSMNELIALDRTPIRWSSGPKPSSFIPRGIKYIVFSGKEDELLCSFESPAYRKMKFSPNENPPQATTEYPVITFDSVYEFLDTISCEIKDSEQDVMSLL